MRGLALEDGLEAFLASRVVDVRLPAASCTALDGAVHVHHDLRDVAFLRGVPVVVRAEFQGTPRNISCSSRSQRSSTGIILMALACSMPLRVPTVGDVAPAKEET